MNNTLKTQTISGMIWTSIQKFGVMIISFIANIVLARLLLPEDFGMIGMLMVFVAVADTLVNGGLGSALIQKKEPTDKDFSTVFYWNLLISIIIYVLLFFTAPSIANFYKMPKLYVLLRVLGVYLIISAFSIIQSSQLVKQLSFNKLAKITMTSTLIGSIISIVMAFLNFGVWSLIAKLLITNFIQCLLFWITNNWKPLLVFSFSSFRQLFKFSSYLLLSNFTGQIVAQFQTLVIGRFFSAGALGYYTQARTLSNIPESAIPQIVDQVMFPIYSSLQDNKASILNALKKSLKSLVFLNFPLMLLLLVIAEPLFIILFSDKWIDSVPYFQIFCFGSMLFSLNSNNVNVIKSLGKSNYILITTIINHSITLILIFIGLKFGIKGVALGYALSMYFRFPVNAYFTGRLINYGVIKQIKDVGPTYLLSVITAILTLYISSFITTHFILKMIIDILMFCTIYVMGVYLSGNDGYKVFLEVIKTTKKRYI